MKHIISLLTFSTILVVATNVRGEEPQIQGSSLITDKKATIASHPTLDSGTGGFMLIRKPNAKILPDQVNSYFDLDSWVLLTIRFNPD